MASAENEFPKVGNDPLFNSEVNDFQSYPKLLYSGTSTDFLFTPTQASGLVIVMHKGAIFESSATTTLNSTITLSISGVSSDTIQIQDQRDAGGGATEQGYTLQSHHEGLGSGTPISGTITLTAGAVQTAKTTIIEYTQI